METHNTSPVSAGSQMIDVGAKSVTHRRAIAQGRIHIGPAALQQIRMRTLPKGDALAIAEVAGIMAAKRTSDLLPLCHPLPLDHISMRCEIEEKSILVTCEVKTQGKTGVEMEALTGVTGALLCIYDVTKGIDKNLSISDVVLCHKEGGRSGTSTHVQGYRAAVVTASDRCFRGEAEDLSGPYIADFLASSGAQVIESALVPDDKDRIKSICTRLAHEHAVDLIITTGGTGLGPRDVTPEALKEISSRPVPGIGELLRKHGAQHTAMSWLSRGEAHMIANTLVITLPGSLKAVTEGMAAIASLLPHALQIIRGGQHESTKGPHT